MEEGIYTAIAKREDRDVISLAVEGVWARSGKPFYTGVRFF